MKQDIPVILLKELVILPNQEVKIELNNNISNKIIKEANLKYDSKVLVVSPIDTLEEEPSIDDLPKVGVIAKIKNRIAIDNTKIRITLRGLKRVAILKYYPSSSNEDILHSEVMEIQLPLVIKEEENALKRKLLSSLEEYISSSPDISNSVYNTAEEAQDLEHLTDIITSFLPFNVNKKIEYMQNINPVNRALSLVKDINEEIKYLQIEETLNNEIQKELDENQKEFILREKLKVIKKELGEEKTIEEEVEFYLHTLNSLKLPKDSQKKLAREIQKFSLIPESSPEASVIRNYLDWVLNLPWHKKTKEEQNYNKVLEELNQSHYGLEEIKERISEYVAIKKINPHLKSPIICLVGPPGVGKTSIAMAIAQALNRKFYKICVGGLNDSTELIGSRRTYLGANPGKIIQGLRKAGSNNPLILIDEVDKMVKDYKGDPASTLLEILDPVQNAYFVDNYIEEPFDLSDVLFILTANTIENIPVPILDRLELIEINSYTMFEKKDIAKNYLLPKISAEHKLDLTKVKISDECLYFLIKGYTYESGVRDLERVLTSLIRKVVINNVKTITKDKIIKLLNTPKYLDNEYDFHNFYGVVNSLAYTPNGSLVTKIEVLKFPGDGKKIITGQIGDILKESIEVATSYIQKEYKYKLNEYNLHFHFLDGSTKKDGPSAGVSITTSLLSALEKKKIPEDIAFTGEISLNGNILKIGGLNEKLIGAYNKGIKVVYIPKSNIDDLKDVDEKIKSSIDIRCVSNYAEIYTNLFK